MGEQHFADKKILSLGLRAAEEDSVNPIFAKPGKATAHKNAKEPKFTNRTPTAPSLATVCNWKTIAGEGLNENFVH
jgi:hypothetical protein